VSTVSTHAFFVFLSHNNHTDTLSSLISTMRVSSFPSSSSGGQGVYSSIRQSPCQHQTSPSTIERHGPHVLRTWLIYVRRQIRPWTDAMWIIIMTNQLKDQRAIIQEQRAIMQTHLDEIDGILARLAETRRWLPNESLKESITRTRVIKS
jgi:hypothetical protein